MFGMFSDDSSEWKRRMKMQKIAISTLLSMVLVSPVALCQTTAQEYYNRGNEHFNAGRYDDAITDYSKAIGLNPRYAEAYNNRGNALAKKGQDDAAITDWTKAIKLNPRYAEAYCHRGAAQGRAR